MLKSSAKAKSLKQQNQPQLVLFAVVNVVGFLLLSAGAENLAIWIEQIKNGDLAVIFRSIAFPAVGSLIVGLINWTVPKHWKEVLIFWHRGARSLPSSEAFTKVAIQDARIDTGSLSQKVGELPTDYGKQSSVWYGVYRKHRAEASVEDANSAYLLYREMTGLVPVIFFGITCFNIWEGSDWKTLLLLLLASAIELGLVISAARNAGYRLVSNVLALESSTPSKKTQANALMESAPTTTSKPGSPRTRKTREAGGS